MLVQKECIDKFRQIEDAAPILWVLADPYCRTILNAVEDKPKSCIKIIAETEIPISTVYRRIQTLQDHNLVRIEGKISQDGKKYFLYKSKVQKIQASFDGKLNVKVVRS